MRYEIRKSRYGFNGHVCEQIVVTIDGRDVFLLPHVAKDLARDLAAFLQTNEEIKK